MKTASDRMNSLLVLYDMYTTFLPKALDGLSAQDAQNRLQTKANHVAWITGSLVQERYVLAGILGTPLQQTAHELFKDHQGIQDEVTYPALETFLQDWNKISPVLRDLLLKAGDEKLDSIFEMMPGYNMSIYELISFTTYREASCIGQIAFMAKVIGPPRNEI